MDIPKLLLISLIGFGITGCNKTPESIASVDSAQIAYNEGDFQTAFIQLKNVIHEHPDDGQARALFGKLFLKLNNPVEAERNIRKAIELGANKNDLLLALGQSLLKQRRFQPIIDEIQFTGNLSTISVADNAEQMALLGQAYLGLGNKDNAAQYFNQAAALVPGQARAVLGFAGLSMLRGETDKARNQIQDVLKTQPKLYDGWVLLGDLERLSSRLSDADMAYTKAIEYSAAGSFEQNLTYLYRALVRAFQDKFEDAKADLDHARSSVNGPNAYVDYITGLIDFKRKDYKAAQVSFESVLGLMPDYTLAQYFLGATHFLEGRPDQARDQLLKFQDKFPDHKETSKMLAVIDLSLNNNDKAAERLNTLLERDPNDTDALNLMAQYYIQTGDLNRGLALFKKTLTFNPVQPNVQLRAGVAAMAVGDLVQADQAFSQALAHDANFRQAEFYAFVSAIKQKHYSEAFEAAKAYQEKHPDEALGYNLEALTEVAQNKQDKAIIIFENVLEQFPGDPSATANLVDAAVAKEQYAEAERLLKASIDKNPNFVRNHLKLATLYFKQARDEAAIAELMTAKQTDPSSLPAILALTEFYLSQDQINSALSVVQDGQKIHQRSPRFLLALGRVYLAAEQYAQANDVLNQMVAVTTSRENPLVLELEALIAAKEKNWPIAKANYEKLYSQHKKSRWLVNLAQASWDSGDQNSAIILLQKRVAANQTDVVARSLLANYLLKSGQADAAKLEYQALIKDMPNDAMSLNNLAWILKDTDPKMAKSLAEKALALKPDDMNIQDTLSSIKS